MKIFFCHAFSENSPKDAYMKNWVENWLQRLRLSGSDIQSFVTGLNYPGRRLPWNELNARWKRGDRILMKMYEDIAIKSENYDVLINFGGVNLHPDFISLLNMVTVWNFYDDPESSKGFSREMAAAYDISAVGNIAELDTYKSWGCKNVIWAPTGFRHDDFEPNKTKEKLFTQLRDIDITLLCERITHFRRAKVDKYAISFPQGIYRGKGWPEGFLPEKDRVPLLQRTKIGINIHNSTGPINFRTFYLPANGVLQICDNKSHLGKIFKLGEEVIGFDTIEEAIEKTKYYLAHEDERIKIAQKAYDKVISLYNEQACFKLITDAVQDFLNNKTLKKNHNVVQFIEEHKENTKKEQLKYQSLYPIIEGGKFIKRATKGIYNRLLRFKDNIRLYLK